MNNREFAQILLCEAVELLNESSGNNGRYYRVAMESKKVKIKSIDDELTNLNKTEKVTRSKHKLAEIAKKRDSLKSEKTSEEAELEKIKKEAKSKGSRTKAGFIQTHDGTIFKEPAISKARKETEVGKKLADEEMRYNKDRYSARRNNTINNKESIPKNKPYTPPNNGKNIPNIFLSKRLSEAAELLIND